jgi:hypothetical protein
MARISAGVLSVRLSPIMTDFPPPNDPFVAVV